MSNLDLDNVQLAVQLLLPVRRHGRAGFVSMTTVDRQSPVLGRLVGKVRKVTLPGRVHTVTLPDLTRGGR